MTTLRTRSSPLEALQLLRAVHLHPVLGERVLEEAADLGAVHALERDVLEHDQLALLAERRERRRQLGADVAAADQRDALGLRELLAQRIGVAASCAGSGSRPAARRRRAGCARSSRSRAAPCRSAPRPCWRASRRARRGRATSRWCASAARRAARRTSRRAGTGCPRATPRRAGTSSMSGGRL